VEAVRGRGHQRQRDLGGFDIVLDSTVHGIANTSQSRDVICLDWRSVYTH
jgi:hypothetical protein